MVMPMESLPFDAFDKAHAAMWRQTMYQFDEDKVKIEELTKAFIDTSFKKLRSAEGESNKNLTTHPTFSIVEKFEGIITYKRISHSFNIQKN